MSKARYRGMSAAFLAFAVSPLLFLSSCATAAKASGPRKAVVTFVSPLRQEALYNGKPQPISAQSSREDAPPFEITYYTSKEACAAQEGGTTSPPVTAGLYYVRVQQPGGGFAPGENPGEDIGEDDIGDIGEDIIVEYHIEKASVTILADENQGAYYDGNPKRVLAACEPSFTLSFSYYPNAQARDAAARAFSQDDAQASLEEALKGFRRVERAPVEQGVYYVLVFFPGDENHHGAYKKVEFTIGPPVRRR